MVFAAGQAGGDLHAGDGGFIDAVHFLEVHRGVGAGADAAAVVVVRHAVQAQEFIVAVGAGGIDLQGQRGRPVAGDRYLDRVAGRVGGVAAELALAIFDRFIRGDHVKAFALFDLRNRLVVDDEFVCVSRIGEIDGSSGGRIVCPNGRQHGTNHAEDQYERQNSLDVLHSEFLLFF